MRSAYLQAFAPTLTLALALGLVACGKDSTSTTTYTVGGAVSGLAAGRSVTLANNGTDSVTVSSDASFAFSSPIAKGSSYAVTVKTQPAGQDCAVAAGSGANVMANVTTIVVTCTRLPQFAYVVNNGDDTISQYSIDAAGTLTPLSPATIATGHLPQSVTVDPSHRFVYVTNFSGNTVSQYVIQKNGTLAPNAVATVATALGPWALAVSASGNWAYVVNSASAPNGSISQYVVNATGGLVAATPPATLTDATPWNVTLSPDGKYMYVSNHGTGASPGMSVSQYSLDAVSGAISALTPPSIPSAANYPGGIAVDANSANAYVANISSNTVSQYALGTAGTPGTLASLSPATVITGTEPVYVAVDPSNRYAYVANFTLDVSPATVGTVSQYTVGTSGQLTPMNTARIDAGIGPAWIAFDSFGEFAYVTNIGNGTTPGTVSEYAIGTGGALSLIGTVTPGLSPFMIATTY